MRLNSKLPLSHPFMARIAAQEIISCGFNMQLAVKRLRPDLKQYNYFATKLLDEPQVRMEMEKIMSRVEQRNPQAFLKRMWDWLDSKDESKEAQERRVSAARILAKGYISDKPQTTVPARPFVVDGMDAGINNLTGVVPSDSDKKVVQ